MPKINVYLPDDLAAAVRAAGVPVSPVCQQALATAVRMVNRTRQAISVIRDPGFDPVAHPVMTSRAQGRMTPRLLEAFALARQAGGDRTGTGQLLLAVVEQGDNLGVRLLQAMEVDPGELTAALRQADLAEPGTNRDAAAGPGVAARPDAGTALGADLTRPAWQVIATAMEAAVDLGHNYLGCEHLVLGLVAETGGVAGRVLREFGADPVAARKTLASILAGYVHGRQDTQQAGTEALGEILRRLDALEARVASLPVSS